MIALADVEGARVGHVLETLRRARPAARARCADADTTWCAASSRISQIARQLGVALPTGGAVARTFSEIEAALVK